MELDYINRQNKRKIGTDYVQLFDLKNDPFETVNLANDSNYQDILEQLANELTTWQHTVNDPLKDVPVLVS